MIGTIASLWRPGIALGFIILMFGIEQFMQTQDAAFIVSSEIVNLSIGVLTLAATAAFLVHSSKRIVLLMEHAALLLLVGLAYLSQLWTIEPQQGWDIYRAALPYNLLVLILAPILMMGKNEIRVGLRTVLFMGIPLLFLFAFYCEWAVRGVRMAAPSMLYGKLTYDSPTLALANCAAFVGILSIILIPKNLFGRILHAITFAIACYIVFRTQSRGQMLAMGLVTIICFPIANRANQIKGLMVTLFGVLILGGLVYVAFTTLDLGNINRWKESHVDQAVEGRFRMIVDLLHAWISSDPFHLLFGLGAGSSFETSGFYVHNLPAEILGEFGVVGFSLFVYIYWTVLTKVYSILGKLNQLPEMRREVVGLLALFLFASFTSLKEGTLSSSTDLILFSIMIGHIERQSQREVRRIKSLRELFITPPQPTGQTSNRLPVPHSQRP